VRSRDILPDLENALQSQIFQTPLSCHDILPIRENRGQQEEMFNRIHHIAIICSDYARSKRFYVETLGLEVIREIYRGERRSFKLDLKVGETYQIELFSYPDRPERLSSPEACGLRHIAFEVDDVQETARELMAKGVKVEPMRVDEHTNKRFTFFRDPDNLPIEIYEK
jgi:glyoxylase I family protein